MKRLVKILALFVLAIVVMAAIKTVVNVRAVNPEVCPGPGNNLIDNISPNVFINLHNDAGKPNCWLTATFLLRTNDLASPNLVDFFKTAAANKILPIVRIGSENSGNDWPAIDVQLAGTDATYLNQAISSAGFPKTVYVELGNEINLSSEWSGKADPDSYASSYIAFAEAISFSNLKPILPALTLNNAAAEISAEDFYVQLKQKLAQKLATKFGCNLTLDINCGKKVADWISGHISGYGANFYAPAGNIDAMAGYRDRLITAIEKAGLETGGKTFIITELGLTVGNESGVYIPEVGTESCKFLNSLRSGGIDISAGTIFARDNQNRVHPFFFSQNGSCDNAQQYDIAVVNLGGSVTYGNVSGYPSSGQIIYKPLGSIQDCPSATVINSNGACSPVNLGKNVCNSECSQPLEIDQGLILNNVSGCLTGGRQSCFAQIKIRGNSLPVPGQAKQLADYFEGTLDAEKTPKAELDALQQAIREGFTNPLFDEAFRKAGVARKLFPKEVQDDLRCKFVGYVGNVSKSKTNSKYFNAATGEIFKVGGVEATKIPCPPKYQDYISEGDPKATFNRDYSDWQRQWAKIWTDVPLFTNDDSLGKIEFVSPSLLTLNPINVSLPELSRLNGVTKEIQNLLVPQDQLDQPESPKTYGKAITFDLSPNSCKPTQNWNDLYGSDFQRGVACQTDTVLGENNLKGCVLLPDGTISCQRTETAGGAGYRGYTNANGSNQATVQVRTVFPHLYETSQQTISFLKGVLHIFRPNDTAEQKLSENYAGIPAKVENVKYELTGSSGLAINDTGHKQKGWDVYFYNLGGLWRAKEFVKDLLTPKK